MELAAAFRGVLERGRLLEGVRRLLVAVSGGPDSMALLRLLLAAREDRGAEFPELLVGHVHHGLRGRSADLNEAFVRAESASLGLECVTHRGNAQATARSRGLSREAAARDLRYEVFRRWAAENELDAIALAHHSDDQAETVLLRAVRGAGLAGLSGIPPSRPLAGAGRPVQVIRPLLSFRRKEIHAHLASLGQAYHIDETNEDATIPRNALRLEGLPFLETRVHPGAAAALVRLAGIARELAGDLDALGARALAEANVDAPPGEVRLSLEALKPWPGSVVREALRRAVGAVTQASGGEGWSPSSRVFSALLEWLREGSDHGTRDLKLSTAGPTGASLEKRYGLLRISGGARGAPAAGAEVPLELGGTATWDRWRISAESVPATACPCKDRASGDERLQERADLDSVLARGPLRVRPRRRGNVFWPLGAPGPKKLKEFFRERRVWPRERPRVPLVVAGDEIVWVVGQRLAHPFRVSDATRRVIELSAGPC